MDAERSPLALSEVLYVPALSEALDLQVRVLESLQVDQLRLTSRCTDWSVSDVLEHTLGVTKKFTEFASGRTDEPHADRLAISPPELSAVVRAVAAESKSAWRGADLERSCRLRFGTFPAAVAAGINLFDVLAHTWDIAAAVDVDLPEEDETWVTGLHAAQHVLSPERDPRHYSPAIGCDVGAPPLVQFLSFLGRGSTSTPHARPRTP